MVYYRKYRPQTIEELDSQEVRDKLYGVLESPSVSHAFLFTGPKGLGKTSTARIVAKVLNCEGKNNESRIKNKGKKENNDKSHNSSFIIHDSKNIEPCNKCDSCKSITHGTNMDILEIDGASNRGIDEIRDLREKVKLSPMRAKVKVYIIDEVHMLTTEAFNALLKTLEEPPNHVVFILCTTEPHKVPATIMSRCLHIQFKKATDEELVRSFERIIKSEGLISDKEALKLIAGLSDGSFRDGVKILEEMAILTKDKKITKDLVEQKYQISSIQYQIAQMIRNLENKDTKSALEGVTKLVIEGVEIAHFIKELIETLHNNLLSKAGIESNAGLTIHSSGLGIQDLKRMIELFAKANSELKYAVLPQLPLELAIIEWIVQTTQKSGNSDSQTVRPASPKLQRGEQSDSPSFPIIQKAAKAQKNEIQPNVVQQNIKGYSENDALWQALIDKVKTYNHSVAGVLRGCSLKSYNGKELVIETNFKFHKEKLSEMKTQEILQKACQEVTKKKIEISVLMRGGEK